MNTLDLASLMNQIEAVIQSPETEWKKESVAGTPADAIYACEHESGWKVQVFAMGEICMGTAVRMRTGHVVKLPDPLALIALEMAAPGAAS